MTLESLLRSAQHAQEQGHYNDAERMYRQLLDNGFQPEAMLNALVRVCLLANSFAQAAEYLLRLTSRYPNKISYCEALANLHVRARNWVAAADCYANFIVHNPTHADAYYNCAYNLKQAAKYQDALVHYQAALDNLVSQPEEVLTNMAVIYSENLRLESKAIESLELALEIAPSYIPALFNLATLYEEEGRKEKAAEYYRIILRLEPKNHSALMRLADAKTVRDPKAAIISQVHSALNDHQIDNAARISLSFSLGKLLDDCGQYDQAFKYYADANRLDRARNPKYSRTKQQKLVQDNITFFSERWFSDLTQLSDAEPIFICGMFRSGSTLVEQVLASHPSVTAGGERDFFLKLDGKIIQCYPSGIDALAVSDLKALADEYVLELKRAFPSAARITDKRPENFLYIGLIKALFPKAKIIHTKRQRLDNSLSIYFLRASASVEYASDLEDIAHYYMQYLHLMEHWQSLFGDDICEVSYDRLVADPEPEVRAMLNFLDLSWEPACLEFHRIQNRVKTASLWQVRQPLYQNSSGRWKNYEKNIPDLISAFKE